MAHLLSRKIVSNPTPLGEVLCGELRRLAAGCFRVRWLSDKLSHGCLITRPRLTKIQAFECSFSSLKRRRKSLSPTFNLALHN